LQKNINSIFRLPIIFAMFVVLGLSFGYLTFKILSFSRTVSVPPLVNMTLLEANEALNKAGLYLRIEGEEFDASIQAGHILRQEIPPGNSVKDKRTIKVVISKGPRVYSLPLIVNEKLAEAESILIQKGLRIGKIINVHSDTVEKGRIVAQKPEPEEKVTDNIIALVSVGPHELSYYCPDFTNKAIDEVKETAEKMDLLVETKGSGEIVKTQRPKSGSIVKSGEKLYLQMKEEKTND